MYGLLFPSTRQLKRIEEALQTRLQKKEVILSTIEDKRLIVGFMVAIKVTIIDGSVKRQLEILKENILKE